MTFFSSNDFVSHLNCLRMSVFDFVTADSNMFVLPHIAIFEACQCIIPRNKHNTMIRVTYTNFYLFPPPLSLETSKVEGSTVGQCSCPIVCLKHSFSNFFTLVRGFSCDSSGGNRSAAGISLCFPRLYYIVLIPPYSTSTFPWPRSAVPCIKSSLYISPCA